PYRFSPEYQPDGQLSKTKALQKINSALKGRTPSFEWQHLRYDGATFDAEVTLNAVIIKGETHLLATVRDITNRKSAERALEISRLQLIDRNESLWLVNKLSSQLHGINSIQTIVNETLNTLLSLSHTPHVAIYLYDKKDNLLHLTTSHGFDEVTQRTGQTIPINGSLSGLALQHGHLLTSEDFSSDDRLHQEIKKALLSNNMNSAAVIPLLYQNRPLGSINLIYNENRTFSNIDKETLETIGSTVSLSIANAQHLNDLEFMAHHDSLTKLSNRLHFHKVFEDMINSQPDISSILLLIDLDRFKEINDTLGHHIGDKLLEQIGPRLKSIDSSYKTHISRLGGDEFTLLVYDMSDQDNINIFAQKVLDSLREPFSIDAMALEIDASIGIARYPMDGKNSHALLRSADVAMYEAKRKGVHYEIYDRGSDKHSPERLALIAELGSAIRNNQLILHYQPKIDSESDAVTGFEALVRWQHPEKGLLYPDTFLPLAEVSETIHYLTQSVLIQALEQQRQWKQSGYDYSVSVNLSARNLIDDRCVDVLENLLKTYETRPGDLEIEITETALMQDPDRAIHLLNRISKLGIKLSIDDYGTGYSSLSYLRQLPIDALKIDRLFVKDMLSNEHDAIIVSSTITLAHNLSLGVVAEGVENETTMNLLKTMGCDLVQGYFISKPMEWRDIERWLKNRT
ncbi:MAG TPA: EAL domain-containing protein, partial [Gammaproteobacteria bacterium]